MICWTSPALPYLTKKPESPLLETDFDTISIASTLGSFLAYIVYPPLAKYFNTKHILLMYAIPQIISWIMLLVDESLLIICISRFISGMAYCSALAAITEYLTTISYSGNRGLLFSILNLASCLGNLLPIGLNIILTYFQMNLVLTIIPIIFLIVFFFMPNSSYFEDLIKWKEEEVKINSTSMPQYGFDTYRTAQKDFINVDESILSNYNSKSSNNNIFRSFDNSDAKIVIFEHTSKQVNLKEGKNDTRQNNKPKCGFKESSYWKLFAEHNNRKAILILTCVTGMDILGGHIPISAYTEQFLTHRGSIIDADKASFIVSILKVFAILISSRFMDRVGRKKILLICGIIGSISLALAGGFFFFEGQNNDITSFGWCPIVFITISEIANVIGVGNTFFALQGELFRKEIQATAISFTNILYLSVQLLALMKFQEMLQYLGVYVIFFFFAFACVSLPIVIFFIGPETQGKTLEEIQKEMKK